MGTYYSIHTDVKVKGKWVNVDGQMKDQKGKERLMLTYESGSRTYFGETADKISHLGHHISFSDLTPEVRALYPPDEEINKDTFLNAGYTLISCDYDTLKRAILPGEKYEHHGIVHKDRILLFETGEIEELYPEEDFDIEIYSKLDKKARKQYRYYEWNNLMGWYSHVQEIIDAVRWKVKFWQMVNYIDDVEDIRIVLIYG